MLMKRYENLTVGVFFTLLGIIGLFLASNFADPVIKFTQTIGSRFFPSVVSGIIIVFGALLILSSIHNLRNTDVVEITEESLEYKRVILTLIAFTVYIFLMGKVGFLIMSIIYLPVQIFALAPEEKRTKKHLIAYAILGVVASLAIYFIFIYGFKVMLPKGIL